jgi:hypothetical protein
MGLSPNPSLYTTVWIFKNWWVCEWVAHRKQVCEWVSHGFSSRLLTLRAQSNIPNSNSPSETDDSSSASSSTDPLLRKLEDAIHRIIVRRAAPDWLPFLPGSSYWVPSPRSTSGSLGIAHLVEKLANPLSDEESLSTTTVRGWPSSDYFVKGTFFVCLFLFLTVWLLFLYIRFCNVGFFPFKITYRSIGCG